MKIGGEGRWIPAIKHPVQPGRQRVSCWSLLLQFLTFHKCLLGSPMESGIWFSGSILKEQHQTSHFPFFHLGYKTMGLCITAMGEKNIYLMLVPNEMTFSKVCMNATFQGCLYSVCRKGLPSQQRVRSSRCLFLSEPLPGWFRGNVCRSLRRPSNHLVSLQGISASSRDCCVKHKDRLMMGLAILHKWLLARDHSLERRSLVTLLRRVCYWGNGRCRRYEAASGVW